MDVCGICYNPGKLICCDDCPAAYHAECLGYERVILNLFKLLSNALEANGNATSVKLQNMV